MTQIEKSELAEKRNLDLILCVEALNQIEAIVDLPLLRNKTRVNEIRKILSAFKRELDRRELVHGS
ncbi:hypothetical protein ABNC96_08195 [Paenibacillus larvae]|uniref:Uncharacterized protein n=1 Tax=Paenibacillus larvae subsp. larvae TaxID=147375 RepID=A0A6C0QSF4_9BACL|nr:hypothetical protein [Paenibacillus larvae]QHZ51166.1 hypothetical protein ERICV_02018 [Paenibacillus larvae subsp. larvae]